LLLCVLSIVIAWPILVVHGIPAFHHDWSWPLTKPQMAAEFRETLQPITSDNFGAVNYYAFNAPFWAISAVATDLAGTEIGLRLVVCGLLAVAGIAMYRLLREQFALASTTATFGALLYTANPIVANRLAAGHLSYLACYAFFPLIAECLGRLGDGRKRAAVLLFGVTPLAVVHPQFFCFFGILAFGLAFGRRRWYLVVVAAALPFVVSPSSVGAGLLGAPAASLRFEETTLRWEVVNSASMLDALELTGYVRDYDRQAEPSLLLARRYAMRALWFAALIGAIRTPRARPYFALAIFGLFMHSGLDGPLATPLAYLFSHDAWFSIFRELYHFAVFTALGLIVCAANCLNGRPALLALATLLTVVPQWTGAYFRGVSFERGDDMEQIAALVSRDPAPGSVLFVPILQPLGRDDAHAGVDPDAYPFPGRAAIHAFVPQAPLVQLDLALRKRPEAAAAILAAYSVRYVVLRPGWRSSFETNLEPSLKELLVRFPPVPERQASLERHLHVVWRGREHALARIDDARPLVHSTPLTTLGRIPETSLTVDTATVADPRAGWADANRWFWLSPDIATVIDPGLLTVGTQTLTATGASNGSRAVLSTTGRATLISSGRRSPVAGSRFAPYPIGTSLEIQPERGVTVFAGAEPAGPTGAAPPTVRGGCARVDRHGERYEIELGAGCRQASLEVVANRSLGFRLRERGRIVVPDPRRWDFQYRVTGPATLDEPIGDRLRALRIVQWAMWLACALALVAWIAFSLVRALGGHRSDDGAR